MPISSIHIARAIRGSMLHNARENFSQSVVFLDEENELVNTSKKAYSIFRNELKKRSAAYFKSVGQNLQKKAVTQMSAIVNLEKHHTLADLKPLFLHIEKELDTVVYQVAIHRDEGKLVPLDSDQEVLFSGKTFFKNPENNELYFDKKFSKKIDLSLYKIEKNYHAHIEFMGIDSDGRSIKRKLSRYFLSELQTKTAQILKMKRGRQSLIVDRDLKTTVKKNEKSARRLDTHDFKEFGVATEKAKIATQKALSAEISALREKLKESNAVRADYAELEALSKKLKAEIKNKNLTIEQMGAELRGYQASREAQRDKIRALRTENYNLSIKAQSADFFLEEAKSTILKQKEEISTQNKALQATKPLQDELDHTKRALRALKEDYDALSDEFEERASSLQAIARQKDYFESENTQYFKEHMNNKKALEHAVNEGVEYAKTEPIATVLQKVVKYAKSLFEKVKSLTSENEDLKAKVSALTKQKSVATKQMEEALESAMAQAKRFYPDITKDYEAIRAHYFNRFDKSPEEKELRQFIYSTREALKSGIDFDELKISGNRP